MSIYLKILSLISLALWREFRKRTQRSLISPSTSKFDETIIADITLINTDLPNALMTGNSSRKQLRLLSIPFLIKKFKKSPIKARDLKN